LKQTALPGERHQKLHLPHQHPTATTANRAPYSQHHIEIDDMSTTNEVYPDNAQDAKKPPVRLAYLPWYCGDFMSSTRGWPVTAKGVYRELIDCQWDLGYLAEDPDELRILIGATPAEWRIAWTPWVEQKFPVGLDGHRRNARLEVHRDKAKKISAARAEAGRLGGQSKAAGKGFRVNGAGQ
jgi:uncharacterized protein YdaU (DUF1376 family)